MRRATISSMFTFGACARVSLVILSVLGLLAGSRRGYAQFQPAPVFGGALAASWIADKDAPGDAFGVFHFRRVLELGARPERFIVHVSADNRYRLFVNGKQVSSGPQRSDLMHWRYETLELAPHLRAGKNVFAALVWNWGPHRPVAQFSRRTAFLLQGDTEREAVVNTGREWKVLRNPGYDAIPVVGPAAGGYYAAPPGESVDGARYPWGWEEASFADDGWPSPAITEGWGAERAQPRGTAITGEAMLWQLVPRSIPAMEEKVVRIATVRRAEGIAPADAFLMGQGDLVVPPRTRAAVLLDNTHLTNAYAVLETSGGSGSTVSLTYAEALKDAKGEKGNRNEIEGKTVLGVKDVFRPGGGERRRFQTLWFRTYRYVQLDVETGDEALRIHDLHGIFTAYPFEEKARFESDLPWLKDMWAMNWRVARLCAWETYFDTPYYEQLQYIGDTRIQALISLYMTGDDRLVRQAITHFDVSRIPEGITASRYPSDLGQYIPTFSLIWVAMVHDYWMHRDDPPYVRGLLPGVRSVLGWYERQLDPAVGLLGPMPWWNFADGAKEWDVGIPPGVKDGHSTLITLQFVYALQRAAELEDALGQRTEGDRYRVLAERIRAAVRVKAWVAPPRGIFLDSPEGQAASQHTNTMAVLVDALPAREQPALMERVLAEPSLVQATYYFGFYVHEALLKAGLADRYIEQLAPWQEMLAMGLTTTAESPEPTRSDSHAWSAHPNYGLLATVLGIRPATPGFRSVRIAPSLGPLKRAEGRMPHPLGNIEVRLQRVGARGLRSEVTLPAGLAGTFQWGKREKSLGPGRQKIEL
jgi:alpha-L-rhamnosidase